MLSKIQLLDKGIIQYLIPERLVQLYQDGYNAKRQACKNSENTYKKWKTGEKETKEWKASF